MNSLSAVFRFERGRACGLFTSSTISQACLDNIHRLTDDFQGQFFVFVLFLYFLSDFFVFSSSLCLLLASLDNIGERKRKL